VPAAKPRLPFDGRPPLALRLAQARLALRLSQHEVAKRAGLRTNYVTQVEAGQIGQPSPEKLAALARALEVPYAELQALPYALAPQDGAGPELPALPPPEPTIFDDPAVPWQVKQALRPWAHRVEPAVLRVLAGALTAAIGKVPAEDMDRDLGPSKELPPHEGGEQDVG
jgi:transcriptional regulator with XRE-family HTH domain